MGIWIVWAVLLFCQNMSSTLTSRARNSASLVWHVGASVLSNGVWFAVQLISIGKIIEIMSGKEGLTASILTFIFYVVCTVSGAVFAHWFSLKIEKGKHVVGANHKYAQIPLDEWEKVQKVIGVYNGS